MVLVPILDMHVCSNIQVTCNHDIKDDSLNQAEDPMSSKSANNQARNS